MKSVKQRMTSAATRMIAPAAPSDMSSLSMPRKCLSIRVPSSSSRSSCVSALAIFVITFLSIEITSLVNGFVTTLSMSGGLSPEVSDGDELMIAREKW